MGAESNRSNALADALVAIIDDSEFSLEITATVIEDAGFSVETTTDENSAVEWAEGVQPDLLLVDLTLSAGSGTDLVAKLKERERLGCPIVLYSGHEEQLVSEAAASCGADGYAIKGDDEDFLAQICQWVTARGGP